MILCEQLSPKISFHVIYFQFVIVDCALQVLIVIFVTFYDVKVALWETPVCHCLSIYIVHIVKKNASLKMLELWFNLIAFFIQEGDSYTKRSLYHGTDPRKRCTVLPAILFILHLVLFVAVLPQSLPQLMGSWKYRSPQGSTIALLMCNPLPSSQDTSLRTLSCETTFQKVSFYVWWTLPV